MAIRAHAQGDSFDQIVHHMGDMVDELLKGDFFRNVGRDSWQPAVNIYEARDRYLICVELAGMDREGIDVEVGKGALYIRGDRPKPHVADSTEEVSVHTMEIDSGQFHRKIPIPRDVNTSGIRAKYRKGYLWIFLPRAEPDKGGADE
jgi:HSP20 family molecular chaperone IbpA